jgi:hypothetical protein
MALVPALANAQATSSEEPPRVEEIRAVERGAFVEGDVGLAWIVNKMNDRGYGPSIAASISAGYDVLPVLSLAIAVHAMSASVNEPDASDTGVRGDLFFLIPMAEAQFALITTERNFLYVRGGAGFAFGLPGKIDEQEYGGNGPAFSGAVGFERFTKLRHFSIGIHAGVLVVTKPDIGIGLSIAPTLKYTF